MMVFSAQLAEGGGLNRAQPLSLYLPPPLELYRPLHSSPARLARYTRNCTSTPVHRPSPLLSVSAVQNAAFSVFWSRHYAALRKFGFVMARFFFLSGGLMSVYLFITERGAEILEKSTCPPSCESPLKIPRNLVQLLAL
jgi:hypothetical protein